MSRIGVVTGARGFIGTHLVRRLAGLGWEVRAVDRRPAGRSAGAGPVRAHQADICDRHAMAPLLEGADTVFHLASMHLEVGQKDAAFQAVNVHATADLVSLASRQGVRRMLHTSSVGVYGDAGSGGPLREDAPKHPDSPYERSKLAGEIAVLTRAAEVGLEVTVLRPAWVYGSGCPRTEKLLRALRKGRFFYFGAGDNVRHPIYIEEMVDAFVLAAQAAPGPGGRIYNVAGPRTMTLREMVETFARLAGAPRPRLHLPAGLGYMAGWAAELAFGALGKVSPLSRRSLAFFRSNNAWDVSAARRDLGFEPRIELVEGVRRLLQESAGSDAVSSRPPMPGAV